MKDWIPLLQSLIWPLFLAIFLISQQNWVREMGEIIKDRIKAGGGFKTPVFELDGHAPKLEPEVPETDEILKKIEGETVAKESPITSKEVSVELAQSLYLVHTAERTMSRDKRYRPYYHVRIQLSAVSPKLLDRVSKAVYHLHPTFHPSTREVTDRLNNFELDITAWGQFTLRAEVYFEGTDQPLTLTRYLNF